MRDSLPGSSASEGGVKLPLKLLVDENIGAPIGRFMVGILSFHPDTPEIAFVVDRFGHGVKDSVWIPQIASEGWVVLSTDRAKRCGGPKLPMICEAHGVTHLLLSTSIHEKKQWEKVSIILGMWKEILKLQAVPKGGSYRLLIRNNKFAVEKYVRKPKKGPHFQQPHEPTAT